MRLRYRFLALTVLALTAFTISAVAGDGPVVGTTEALAAKGDPIRTAATRYNSGDRVKTVPISKRAWGKTRSVMSLGPNQIGRIEPGKRIEGTAEAQITVCAKAHPNHPGTPCVGRTYGYDPRLKMKIVLASSAGATSGKKTMAISRTRSLTCSQHQPNRNRHCILSIPWGGIKVPKGKKLPCPPGGCHMNVLISASRSSARSGDVVVVGSSDDRKRIHQGRGRLSSALFSGATRALRVWNRSKPYKRKLQVGPDDSDGNRQVAYSLPLRGLRKGDQILVDARSVTRIGHLPYNITQRATLIFTDSPGSVKPSGKVLESNPRLSADSGYGCTQGPSAHSDPCVVGKSGLLSVRKGSKKTWYVNLVVTQEVSDIAPKANKWRSSHRVKMQRGSIRARRYRGISICETCAGSGTFNFSATKRPGKKTFRKLVSKLQNLGIEEGRVSCTRRKDGPKALTCSWHAEGRYGSSPRYVCDSKAFLMRKSGAWNVLVCRDSLGAQLWHKLEQRNISPTFAGGCKQRRKTRWVCNWFAKGEWASGPYFCKGSGRYNTRTNRWSVDRCKNQRD